MGRLLGTRDEPQQAGAVVAVHHGDYRRQEIWVSSGSNIGIWYCLGGESGRPKVWDDPRPYADRMFDPGSGPVRPEGTIPAHPDWYDVLARGPVTLLTAGDSAAYIAGWVAGRRDLWTRMEESVSDRPT